jgi:hypothetical protein
LNDPWSILESGDSFRIVSYSGKKYEGTFLQTGPQEAGLYVRLQDKKLARFSPSRLIWTSLERLAPASEILFPGDDVLVQTKDGPEALGKLSELARDTLTIKTTTGKVVPIPYENMVAGTFRLLFPASDLRAGDEFLVRSSSGREYRARAAQVEKDRVAAVLPSGGEPVAIRVEHLDLRTLYVLIPLDIRAGSPRG